VGEREEEGAAAAAARGATEHMCGRAQVRPSTCATTPAAGGGRGVSPRQPEDSARFRCRRTLLRCASTCAPTPAAGGVRGVSPRQPEDSARFNRRRTLLRCASTCATSPRAHISFRLLARASARTRADVVGNDDDARTHIFSLARSRARTHPAQLWSWESAASPMPPLMENVSSAPRPRSGWLVSVRNTPDPSFPPTLACALNWRAAWPPVGSSWGGAYWNERGTGGQIKTRHKAERDLGLLT
jgi:hypothetical protein